MAENSSTGRLVSAVGGILLIVSLFLSWYGFDLGTNTQFNIDTSISGWDALGPGDLLLLVAGLIALAPFVLDATGLEIELPVEPSVLALGAGVIATLEVLLRIIDKPGPDVSVPGDFGLSLKYGIFIALIGAVAAAAGGYLQSQEADTGVDAFAQSPPPTGPTYTDPAGTVPPAMPEQPAAAPPPPSPQPPQPPVPPQGPNPPSMA
ncbi:MAG TPA: hypothetical protein VGO97_05790 [Solirubrobacterales bacterium]|nr:hypothetical protein [Solirubrobacterales bacterium]